MAAQNQDLGEEALSTAAEVAMSTQLDASEDLDVDMHANPLDLMQGNVDAVEIDGKGLVMNKDLRTEELELETNRISIDPLKAAFGKIELTQPTDASAHIVLTEADMERAFNSEFLQDKLRNLTITVEGQETQVEPKRVKFRLPGEGIIELSGEVRLVESGETQRVGFTATPTTQVGGNRVTLENIQPLGEETNSPQLRDALINSAQELLDLRNFELEGMSLRFRQLDVQQGKLILEADANVQQFPAE